MNPIPQELLDGPFTTDQARGLGVSARMLMGKRFVRIHPRVHRAADHEMSSDDWLEAAALALPPDARLTGISRIQRAGLDFGPRFPVRFVVARDHHIALDGIFLHRTKRMPPNDGAAVSLAAAFVSYCSLARVLDAIRVGDWLLRSSDTTMEEVRMLALEQLWRAGSNEALWILPHLDAQSRSLPESATRTMVSFAGLPAPQVNQPLLLSDGLVVMGDLLFHEFRTIVEYEGSHHQNDREQYARDIDRYALLRDHAYRYVQVTKEKMRRPRRLVEEIDRQLRAGGYSGPPPVFTGRWPLLFSSVAVAVGPRAFPATAA